MVSYTFVCSKEKERRLPRFFFNYIEMIIFFLSYVIYCNNHFSLFVLRTLHVKFILPPSLSLSSNLPILFFISLSKCELIPEIIILMMVMRGNG